MLDPKANVLLDGMYIVLSRKTLNGVLHFSFLFFSSGVICHMCNMPAFILASCTDFVQL